MEGAKTQDKPRPGGSLGRFVLVGGAAVVVAHSVGLVGSMGSQMLLARLLAPEHLAAYFLTLSVVEVAAHLAHLGLPRPVTRLVAQACGRNRRDQARGVLETAVPFWLLASLTVAVGYASGFGDWLARRAFGSEIMASGVTIAALWIVFQGAADLTAGALRGFRRVGLAAWVGGALPRTVIVVTLLGVYLSVHKLDFSGALWIATGAVALAPVTALLVLRREVRDGPSERELPRSLLAAGLPLLLTGIVNMGYQRADLFAVGALFEAEQVALYGAAKRLIVLISMPLVILSLVIPPIVAELHASRDLERLQRALRGAATLAGIPAIAVLAIFVGGSEWVLDVVYGDFFRDGATVLVLLCIERMVFVWVGPSAMVLAMTGNEAVLMRITVCTSVVTVTCVAAGAHLHGFHGVAAGYVLGSMGQQIATWLAVRRLTGLRTDVDLLHLSEVLQTLRRVVNK